MPPDLLPMLAAGVPRSVVGRSAEPKLDGWRARMLVDDDRAGVRTRRGNDVTAPVPGAQAPLDAGLWVVLWGTGRAGAGTLQDFYRVGLAVARRGRSEPVTFVAFDLLWADGQLLTGEAHDERRRPGRP